MKIIPLTLVDRRRWTSVEKKEKKGGRDLEGCKSWSTKREEEEEEGGEEKLYRGNYQVAVQRRL